MLAIDELHGQRFHTKPLRHVDAIRVATVAAGVLQHFVHDRDWVLLPHKGSVTLQSPSDNHQVVKVFVDYDNDLAGRSGIVAPPDPVVMGVELTTLPLAVRDAVREWLNRDFRLYVDPRRAGATKWWLPPIQDHFYDILFLEPGPCRFELSEELVADIVRVIQIAIEKGEAGPELRYSGGRPLGDLRRSRTRV